MIEDCDPRSHELRFAGLARSAAVVVPLLLKLFPSTRSVVEVGCGSGAWLHQFRLLGVPRVLGLDDGDIPANRLQIDEAELVRAGLSGSYPFDERFDLAMCLEVADRIEPAIAENFVSDLARLSDVIVFGAAIPGQGAAHHGNERWPTYWSAFFERRGFRCFDVLRGQIWYDYRVEWWYAQNILVFVNTERSDLVADLERKADACRPPLDLVHPRCFEAYRDVADQVTRNLSETVAINPYDRSLLLSLQARLNAIEQSSSWRAVTALQRMVAPFPRLRGLLRRAARLLGGRSQ